MAHNTTQYAHNDVGPRVVSLRIIRVTILFFLLLHAGTYSRSLNASVCRSLDAYIPLSGFIF